MEQLKVASAQFELTDGDIGKNMEQAEKMVRTVMKESDVDLMLFCEVCLDNPGNLENIAQILTDDVRREIREFWLRMAKISGMAILAGYIDKNEAGRWQNFASCFTPEGEILGTYAKSHLYFSERNFFEPGDDPVVFTYKGWRIAPLICADLGFPEFSRIQASKGVDLFCVPSCWAYPHDELWILSNRMRAAENGAYLVSCNRLGAEDGGRMNLGHSMAVNPEGDVLANLSVQKEGYFIVNLYKDEIAAARESCQWLRWVRPELYKALL